MTVHRVLQVCGTGRVYCYREGVPVQHEGACQRPSRVEVESMSGHLDSAACRLTPVLKSCCSRWGEVESQSRHGLLSISAKSPARARVACKSCGSRAKSAASLLEPHTTQLHLTVQPQCAHVWAGDASDTCQSLVQVESMSSQRPAWITLDSS